MHRSISLYMVYNAYKLTVFKFVKRIVPLHESARLCHFRPVHLAENDPWPQQIPWEMLSTVLVSGRCPVL